jgi:hypothetical protein
VPAVGEPITPAQWLLETDTNEQLSQKLLRRMAENGLGALAEEMTTGEIQTAKEFLAYTMTKKSDEDLRSRITQFVPVINITIGKP